MWTIKFCQRSFCSRLGKVLPDLICPFQTCGVRGRSIHDNIRLLRDSVAFVDEKNLDSLVISLDQSKAFDRVNWSFLFRVLERFGFGPKFIHWINILYTDIFSKILINGHLSDPFLLSKGVRQGCPLSPLLYVLFIEPFVVSIMKDSRIGGLIVPGSGGL